MAIRAIFAVNKDNIFGRNNKLPWIINADLKRFQHLTTQVKDKQYPKASLPVVVMGRSTWFSLPGSKRPLKDRINAVLSTDPTLKLQGADVHTSLDSVIEKYGELHDIWLIGGSKLLQSHMHLVSEIKLTYVENKVDGDVRGPKINFDEWDVTTGDLHQEGIYKFRYIDLVRKTA